MTKPMGLARTFLLVTLVDLSLRGLGYARVIRWAKKLVRLNRSASSDIDLESAIRGTQQTILTATALYPGRSQCLEQAVVGFVLLRRIGLDVRVRLGVQPYPFRAHAWLELNGRPLTETPEAISQFALIPDLAS